MSGKKGKNLTILRRSRYSKRKWKCRDWGRATAPRRSPGPRSRGSDPREVLKMEQTVVGLFDDRDDAQDAMAELIQEGFIKENIDLSNRGTALDSGSDEITDTDTGIGDR